jgi:hypothetical protein
MNIVKILSGLLIAVAVLGLLALILGLPLMLLWNWLMPIIFLLPKITFWQAVGLTFLTGILFKFRVTITAKIKLKK